MANWAERAAFSQYRTVLASREALRHGDLAEATVGIEALLDAMEKAERRALQSQLERLMQPRRRSRSWRRSITQARQAMHEMQEDTPSLTDAVIHGVWARALGVAYDEAQEEVGMDFPFPHSPEKRSLHKTIG